MNEDNIASKLDAKIKYFVVNEIEDFQTEVEYCLLEIRHNEHGSFIRVKASFELVNIYHSHERAQFILDDEIFFSHAQEIEFDYYVSYDELILNRVIAANEDRREQIESLTLSNLLATLGLSIV